MNSSLDLAVALLAAHLAGDFVFQTNRMAKQKGRLLVLLSHCAIVAGLSYLFAGRWAAWPVALIVLFCHALTDYVKVRVGGWGQRAFLVDQVCHLAVIAALAYGFGPKSGPSVWFDRFGPTVGAIWILLSGFILCVRVGGLLVGFWVQPYLEEIQANPVAVGPGLKPTRGLTNGGRVIGQWERALIFIFVGLGQPTAIGFLIAAKSIFRFGELKDRENRMEAEYITIGTLMSFGWAVAVSYAAWRLAR